MRARRTTSRPGMRWTRGRSRYRTSCGTRSRSSRPRATYSTGWPHRPPGTRCSPPWTPRRTPMRTRSTTPTYSCAGSRSQPPRPVTGVPGRGRSASSPLTSPTSTPAVTGLPAERPTSSDTRQAAEECIVASPDLILTTSTCDDVTLPINPFVSNRYHFGMLLGVADLDTDQGYHRGKAWLHTAWLHGDGTVWGLQAELRTGTNELAVLPGLAID